MGTYALRKMDQGMGTDQQGLIRVITIKAERGGTVLGTTDTVQKGKNWKTQAEESNLPLPPWTAEPLHTHLLLMPCPLLSYQRTPQCRQMAALSAAISTSAPR